MDTTALGHNIRRLREARKLSQNDVAQRAGLSRVAYGNIEAGSSSPKVETLMRVASALEVKLQELLEPVRVLNKVRFRARKKMTTRDQILVEVARWLEDYEELEQILDDRVEFALEKLVREFANKVPDPKTAAAKARSALGLDDDEPIRDICGLLEERGGIKVYPLPVASDGFFGLSVGREDGGPAIVVNVWERHSVERWIFTAAHELGHLLLHFSAFDVAQTDEDKDEEHEADQFAGHFLMPHKVFKKEWDETRGLHFVDRVLKVKRIFHVSYRTVLYRLSEQPEYGQSIWRQFQIAYKNRFGRGLKKTDEPIGLSDDEFGIIVESRAAGEPKRLSSEDFVEDRLYRLVRSAFDRQLISVGRGAEILGVELRAMREHVAAWVD